MAGRKFPIWARVVVAIYLLACVASYVLIMVAGAGQSLSGIYAVLLAMPWVLLLSGLQDWLITWLGDTVVVGMFFTAIGMALNVLVFYGLIRALKHAFHGDDGLRHHEQKTGVDR